MAGALKDFDLRRRHRAWRRDCMAMAGEPPARRANARPLLLGLIVLIAILAYGVSQSSHPDQALGAVVGVGGVGIGGLGALALLAALLRRAWRLLRRERRKADRPVTVAVSKPPLVARSLDQAYRSLPSYCARLLKDRS